MKIKLGEGDGRIVDGDALREHLESALERSDDDETRYHVRQALQLLTE